MMQYVKNILIPYIKKVKSINGIDKSQKSLIIFDVYKAHQDVALLSLMKENDMLVVFVPASCTGELQPLDLTINKSFKDLMKDSYIKWSAEVFAKSILEGDVTRASSHLRISVIKPIHANWLIQNITKISERRSLIINGFRKAGII